MLAPSAAGCSGQLGSHVAWWCGEPMTRPGWIDSGVWDPVNGPQLEVLLARTITHQAEMLRLLDNAGIARARLMPNPPNLHAQWHHLLFDLCQTGELRQLLTTITDPDTPSASYAALRPTIAALDTPTTNDSPARPSRPMPDPHQTSERRDRDRDRVGTIPPPAAGYPGLSRVADADPRRLGVHRAIAADRTAGGQPEYVERDTDLTDDGLRSMVRDAARRGGFVVLVGDSSVGKTRSGYEAIRALLPFWWLLVPGHRSGDLAAFAASPVPRTVVWLDELHRHLSGDLTDDLVARMLDAPEPVLIIGTLSGWHYLAYTARVAGAHANGDPEHIERKRATLALGEVIRIDVGWSDSERIRAEDTARRDSRIAEALSYPAGRYSPPQILAAAPQLVERWELADPYSRAVLHATADLTRLGHRSPLSVGLLHSAASAYCDDRPRARAPDDWFESALAYCTELLNGAAAALEAVPGEGMGQVAGYVLSDYLLQHTAHELRRTRVPAGLWDAAVAHVTDAADAERLAAAAGDRLLLRYSMQLLQRAVDGGALVAVHRLADLLVQQDNLGAADEALAAAAAGGYTSAAFRLAEIRAAQNDVAGAVAVLQPAADAGDVEVAARIAQLLADADDTAALRARAGAGDPWASQRLAELLAADGHIDDATAVLRAAIASGNHHWLRRELIGLLERNRDDAGALAVIREAVADGDPEAACWLADILAKEGETDGAIDVLRPLAQTGDTDVVDRLSRLVEARDGPAAAIGLLEQAVDAGHTHLGRLLADRLAAQGAIDALREWAATDDTDSAVALVTLLAARKDVDGLGELADGDGSQTAWRAAEQLARLLTEEGEVDTLRERAASDPYAARAAGESARARGELPEAIAFLRTAARSGDSRAAFLLVELLAERADVAGLATEAENGNRRAAFRLAEVLAAQDDVDGVTALAADSQTTSTGIRRILYDLLARLDQVDTLSTWADRDHSAARRLAEVYTARGEIDRLRTRAADGDRWAERGLADVLAKRGDVEGLRAEVLGGSPQARDRLLALMARRNRIAGERLRRFGQEPDTLT